MKPSGCHTRNIAALHNRAKVTAAVRLIAAACLALGSPSQAAAEDQAAAQASPDVPPGQAPQAAREWFQDAKFGVFLHWGLYSQVGGIGGGSASEWIMQDARIPISAYEQLALSFNPQQFDAEEWVSRFKDVGAKYIVITAKHHDGFAMFASKASPYNIVDSTPFKRDPMKELAAACRRQGIKLFFYYSQLDWHNPDYFPRGRTGHDGGRPLSGDWEKYLDYQDAQLRELLTNYGPIGGIWFDGWWDQEGTAYENRWRLERTYRMIHELQPDALIVNNHHKPPFPGEDYQVFERDLPGQNTFGFNKSGPGALPLEMAETMNGSWGFSLVDDKYKSTRTLVQTLVGAAGRNANLLLNTGPMPNGQIQPRNLQTMVEIGEWLKTYGPSIYGTRAGPVSPRPWGVTTAKDKTIFVHILDWSDDTLFVPIDGDIEAARLLSDGTAIPVRKVTGGVEIGRARQLPNEWDRVVALTMR